MTATFTQKTTDDLDYQFDWSDWLASGETISSFVITAETGITVGTDAKAASNDSTSVTVWLTGGTDRTDYTVDCKMTTSAGRVRTKSIILKINDRARG